MEPFGIGFSVLKNIQTDVIGKVFFLVININKIIRIGGVIENMPTYTATLFKSWKNRSRVCFLRLSIEPDRIIIMFQS